MPERIGASARARARPQLRRGHPQKSMAVSTMIRRSEKILSTSTYSSIPCGFAPTGPITATSVREALRNTKASVANGIPLST